VLKNAEAYYRAMVRGGPDSWNIRDRHMTETLERLMHHHGPRARAIVWEHNTHIGDARFTDMAEQGEINLGQLVRERHGEEGVRLVGFGCTRAASSPADSGKHRWSACACRPPVRGVGRKFCTGLGRMTSCSCWPPPT
jgi:erythromycin esterase